MATYSSNTTIKVSTGISVLVAPSTSGASSSLTVGANQYAIVFIQCPGTATATYAMGNSASGAGTAIGTASIAGPIYVSDQAALFVGTSAGTVGARITGVLFINTP